MPEGFPQPEKQEIREEEVAEIEGTPQEWREKLRKLIEGMGG